MGCYNSANDKCFYFFWPASAQPGAGIFFTSVSILAKVIPQCYLQIMELLEQLESQVEALLARLDRLKAENARISAESAAVAAQIDALDQENQKLREALENEETLRTEALNRIDALLRRIREHDSVE